MDFVQTNIEEHFREKYEELFNSADDGVELMNVQLETDTDVVYLKPKRGIWRELSCM